MAEVAIEENREITIARWKEHFKNKLDGEISLLEKQNDRIRLALLYDLTGNRVYAGKSDSIGNSPISERTRLNAKGNTFYRFTSDGNGCLYRKAARDGALCDRNVFGMRRDGDDRR